MSFSTFQTVSHHLPVSTGQIHPRSSGIPESHPKSCVRTRPLLLLQPERCDCFRASRKEERPCSAAFPGSARPPPELRPRLTAQGSPPASLPSPPPLPRTLAHTSQTRCSLRAPVCSWIAGQCVHPTGCLHAGSRGASPAAPRGPGGWSVSAPPRQPSHTMSWGWVLRVHELQHLLISPAPWVSSRQGLCRGPQLTFLLRAA